MGVLDMHTVSYRCLRWKLHMYVGILNESPRWMFQMEVCCCYRSCNLKPQVEGWIFKWRVTASTGRPHSHVEDRSFKLKVQLELLRAWVEHSKSNSNAQLKPLTRRPAFKWRLQGEGERSNWRLVSVFHIEGWPSGWSLKRNVKPSDWAVKSKVHPQHEDSSRSSRPWIASLFWRWPPASWKRTVDLNAPFKSKILIVKAKVQLESPLWIEGSICRFNLIIHLLLKEEFTLIVWIKGPTIKLTTRISFQVQFQGRFKLSVDGNHVKAVGPMW